MKSSTREDYLERIRRVLRFIQEHLDEPLAADRLAGVAHLSTFHFHRIFSGLVGESIGEHVRRLRLERAAGELRLTDKTVVEIALGAGYEAHEPFTRAFRGHFGLPPSKYRDAWSTITLPPSLCGVHYGTDEAVARFVPLEEGSHMIDVFIDHLPARHLVGVAHHGNYQNIGQAFGTVCGVAAEKGWMGPETSSLGIYYDDPDVTPVERLRSHACVTVPASVQTAPAGCEIIDLPAGEYAIGVHRGPYRNLHASYRWMFGQWLPSSGRELANAPACELYVNDPETTPEAELITHICVPLA